MSHNGSSVTVKFDQSISLSNDAEANGEFQLVGDGNVIYTVNLGTNTSDATHGTISRSTAYTDRYGAVLGVNDPVDITVTAATNTDANVNGQPNSMLTLTMVDPDTTVGASGTDVTDDNDDIDFTSYLNALSYGSAAAASGSNTVSEDDMGNGAGTELGFYLDYPNLRDNNFNSWDVVEEYDQYDGQNTPRLLGAESQGPRLAAQDGTLGPGDVSTRDADGTYLHLSSGITITSIHATDPADTDVVYTASTTGAITGATTDTELGYVYGIVNGGVAALDTNVRLVIKTTATDLDVRDAVAFVYNPDFTGAGTNVGLTGGTIIVPTDASVAGTTTVSYGVAGSTGSVGINAGIGLGSILMVELPDLAAVPTAGDTIVISNIWSNSHVYSIHIPIPSARALTTGGGTAPSTTEAGITSLNPVVYKHVFLDNNAVVGTDNARDVVEIQTSTAINSATGSLEIEIPFIEQLASTVTGTWTRGDDDDQAAADGTVNFAVTAVRDTADSRVASLTLNALTATADPVTETTTRYVGHDAELNATVTDHSGNTSTVKIKLQKGHGAAVGTNAAGGESTDAILNIISGSAID
jgi:hypothetical protein